MQKPSAFPQLVSCWSAILLGVALATAGWVAKLCDWNRADFFILAGSGLVVVAATLALRQLARQIGLPILLPLTLLTAGMAVLVLEPLCQELGVPVVPLLRPLGETVAALGVVRLLLSLNKVLATHPPKLKALPTAGIR